LPQRITISAVDKATKRAIPNAAIAEIMAFNSASQDSHPMGFLSVSVLKAARGMASNARPGEG
jgi:hypothetical protein